MKDLNVNKSIDKLLYALEKNGKIYKINSFKFYSQRNNRYCTKYQVLKKELVDIYNTEKNEIEIEERYKVKKECYSKIDLLKYLIEEHKQGSEADEE